MRKHKKDVDLIQEAYESQIQQLDEWGQALAAGVKALAPQLGKQAAMTGATVAGTNIANKLTNGNSEPPQQMVQDDAYEEDENITDLEPGENITSIKKDAIIKAIISSVDELISGNTGPDSPCGEREAIELIERHCKHRLDEIGPAAIGAIGAAAPAAIDAVGSMLGGGQK